MNIVDLKNAIEDGSLSDNFIILVAQGNRFLAEMYVDEICKSKGMQRRAINCLAEMSEDSAVSLIMDFYEDLNVLTVDTFDEKAADYEAFVNTVVICNKIDKKVASKVEPYAITVPAAGEWQIKSFVKYRCSGLNDDDVDALYALTAGDIYRIDNELSKIEIFPEAEQTSIVRGILLDKSTDLIPRNPYEQLNFADYLIVKDIENMRFYMEHMNIFQFEAIPIVASALKKVRQVLLLKYNTKDELQAVRVGLGLGESNKYGLYKRLLNVPLSMERAKYLLGILSKFDQQLKNGEFDVTDRQLFDYMLCKMAD